MKTHREYVAEQSAKNPKFKKALDDARLEARLALQLTKLREHRGWSQRELAQVTGIKQPQIARIESGTRLPNLDTLQKVAEALDATITISPRRAVGVEVKAANSRRR